MNIEEARKLCKEEFMKNVMANLDSALIFTYISNLEKENTDLKKQLEYLRSGEYLNQLKFERNMLENIVQNMEVSKEDKEFIDMTHRNTELLEESQTLKEKIKETNKGLNKVRLKRKKWKYQYYKERNKNKELKDRINKAIEYMEQWGNEPDADMYMQMKDYNEFKYLLKILKEDNKEVKDDNN